jgi:hypothetical protein
MGGEPDLLLSPFNTLGNFDNVLPFREAAVRGRWPTAGY